MNILEDSKHVFISLATSHVLRVGVGVDDLLSQTANREVRSLREEHDVLDRGTLEIALEDRPETSDHTCDSGLTDTVGTSDENMLAWIDFESEVANELLASALESWRWCLQWELCRKRHVGASVDLALDVTKIVERLVCRQIGGSRDGLVIARC